MKAFAMSPSFPEGGLTYDTGTQVTSQVLNSGQFHYSQEIVNEGANLAIVHKWTIPDDPGANGLVVKYQPELYAPLGPIALGLDPSKIPPGSSLSIDKSVSVLDNRILVHFVEAQLGEQASAKDGQDLHQVKLTLSYEITYSSQLALRLTGLFYTAAATEFPLADSSGGGSFDGGSADRLLAGAIPTNQPLTIPVGEIQGDLVGWFTTTDMLSLEIPIE
ncbi:MAG TPA: hypothetical protein PLC98_23245 [Anaerolineales bacterium]|nr:hypothetical protein [Anaerolineales bacterium]